MESFPPIPQALHSSLKQRVLGLLPGARTEPPPVMVVGNNYGGLFGQLQHRIPFDGVPTRSVRVLRIGSTVGTRPDAMPNDSAEEIGTLTSCATELMGVAAASLWFQLFSSTATIFKRLYTRYRQRGPSFERDASGYLNDLMHDIALAGPCIFLIDSIDQDARDLFLNLALYEHRWRPTPGRLVICGVDAPGSDPPEALTPVLPAEIARGNAEWSVIAPLDRMRVRSWLGTVDGEVVDSLLAHVGNGRDDRAAVTWSDWVATKYVVQAGGRWAFSGVEEPTEGRVHAILAARLAGQPELPANSMNLAMSALSIAGLGGERFPQQVVAETTAALEGGTVDEVTDVLDSLVPTDGPDPALIVEDGCFQGPNGWLWRHRFVSPLLGEYLANRLDLPSGAVVESLLRGGRELGFPEPFAGFFARVAHLAGGADLAERLLSRQRYAARHRALLDRAVAILGTAAVIDYDAQPLVDLAFDLFFLGEIGLSRGVGSVALASRSPAPKFTVAMAHRVVALAEGYTDPESACAHFETAIGIMGALCSVDTSNLEWRISLAHSLRELAGLLRVRDVGEAERLYGRSLELYEGLYRVDPSNHQWARGLAVGLGELAGLLRDRDVGEAERLYCRSLELHEGLYRLDPSNDRLTRDLRNVLIGLADLVRGRDVEESLHLFGRAVQLFFGPSVALHTVPRTRDAANTLPAWSELGRRP